MNPKDISQITLVEDDTDFRLQTQKHPNGIVFRSRRHGDSDDEIIEADVSDFAKWLTSEHPHLPIDLPNNTNRLLLRNEEIWLPLAFIAGDVSLPIYLNLVSNYLYDRMKGSLKGSPPKVNLTVEYHDATSGKTKRFKYSGDGQTLMSITKKFDVNKFLDDNAAS